MRLSLKENTHKKWRIKNDLTHFCTKESKMISYKTYLNVNRINIGPSQAKYVKKR